ncbi:MAG TPA: RNA polymerase sigma factor [Thermoanaerobaculia bacterium]
MDFTGVMNDALLAVAGARSKSEAGAMMDEETFRAFYDRTSRAVWVYLARVTGDRHLADDLLQETYYRFYKAGAAHHDEGHRRNSLFCIATNIARDTHRRSARYPVEPLEVNEADEETVAIDTRIAERFEESTDLWRAMAQLKPVQREMLWLAYALGSTHAEIAEIVGVKSGSVKILLFRARRKLAVLLGRPA